MGEDRVADGFTAVTEGEAAALSLDIDPIPCPEVSPVMKDLLAVEQKAREALLQSAFSEPRATELRPSPEHADKSLHWIATGKEATVGRWFPAVSEWQLLDDGQRRPAHWMVALGYRYLGPAEWVPETARDKRIISDQADRVVEQRVRIAELEAENARLGSHAEEQANLARNSIGIRDFAFRCGARGWISRPNLEDGFVRRETVENLKWVYDEEHDDWHAPGLVFDPDIVPHGGWRRADESAALREQVRIMETRAYIAEGRVKELETENARLRLIADTVPQYQAAIQELRDANSFWSLPPRVHNADAPGVTRLPPSHGLSHLRISERTRCEATETAVAQLAERRALVPEVGGSIPPGGATLGPRKGEFVTCTSGHMICEVMADIEVDDLDWARKLGAWRLETPPVPVPVPACPCGAEWVRPWPVNTLHIKGRGWV